MPDYTVFNAIDDFYVIEKRNLRLYGILDEDVFHSTIVRCIDVFLGKEVHKENVLRYFSHSYKINLWREKLYIRDRLILDKPDLTEEDMDKIDLELQTTENLDYQRLKAFLWTTFGKKLSILLRKYNLGGYTIKELEDLSGEKGLHYKFKKMRDEARKHFPDLVEDE